MQLIAPVTVQKISRLRLFNPLSLNCHLYHAYIAEEKVRVAYQPSIALMLSMCH
jgi:hypothetical protein